MQVYTLMRKYGSTQTIITLLAIAIILILPILSTQTVQAITEYDAYDTGDDSSAIIQADTFYAQTFTATESYNEITISLKMYEMGDPVVLTIGLYETDGGLPSLVETKNWLSYDTFVEATQNMTNNSSGTWYDFVLKDASAAVSMNTKYAIVCSATSDNADDAFRWKRDGSAATYAGGSLCVSMDGGSSWAADTDDDFQFRVSGTVTDQTRHEYYTGTDDNCTAIYGDNYSAQTFTTDNAPHTIERIRLNLLKVGDEVGDVYCYLTAADNTTGLPTMSENYTFGVIDGDSVDNATDGWYYFNLIHGEYTSGYWASVNTMYAIVVTSTSSNTTDYIDWQMVDNGTYAFGTACQTIDGGTTWNTDIGDYLFEIWGEHTMTIEYVRVYSDFKEPGDRLIGLLYRAEVPPAYPGSTSQYCMAFYLNHGNTHLAKANINAWGYYPGCIYLRQEQVDYLNFDTMWKDPDINITLEVYDAAYGDNPDDVTYYLTESDWIGTNLLWLDAQVRALAQSVEAYYADINLDVYTEAYSTPYGTVTSAAGMGYLTPVGGEIFERGVPGLMAARPELFITASGGATMPGDTHKPTNQNNPENILGPLIMGALNSTGNIIHLSGKQFGGGLLFFLVIASVNFLAKVSGDVRLPLAGGGVMVMLIGWYTGLMPVTPIVILAMLVVTLFVYNVFWSRT